jgi:hypothetical protein
MSGLDVVEQRKVSFPCRELIPGRPAGILSLYRVTRAPLNITHDVLSPLYYAFTQCHFAVNLDVPHNTPAHNRTARSKKPRSGGSTEWQTLWSRALLQRPPVVQLLKNFPALYATRRFITVRKNPFTNHQAGNSSLLQSEWVCGCQTAMFLRESVLTEFDFCMANYTFSNLR